MKQVWLALTLTLLFALPRGVRAHASHDYHIEDVEIDAPSSRLLRTTLTISAGDEPLNTFNVVRVHRRERDCEDDPPLMLLSPFGFRSQFWELTTNEYEDSFVARVALAGYDVWLVDNRTAVLPPGSCESGAVDCSPLSEWGVDTGVADALFVRSLVHIFHPFQKPVVGGYSGGSSAALATVNAQPQRFSGLFLWEGTLYTADPDIRARNAAFCADDEAQLAAGVVVDSSVQGFKTIYELAIAAPNDPSPLPGFPPGTTNQQALVFAFATPNPENPLNFTAGFIRLIGDPWAGTFTYADLGRVLSLGPLIGTYAPVRFLRDSHCAIGGLTSEWTSGLDKFRGDVLVYAEGFGFGSMMVDTAGLMTRARVTLDYHAELGESDRYYHRDWVALAVQPLLDWLSHVRRF